MLSCPRLGDDAFLAHAACDENLSDGIVDFVGSGVVQVFALQIDAAVVCAAEALGEIEWGGATDIVAQQLVELLLEVLAVNDLSVLFLQFFHTLVEDFRDVGSAVASEEPVFRDVKFTHVSVYVFLCDFSQKCKHYI